MSTLTKAQKADKAASIAYILGLINEGATIAIEVVSNVRAPGYGRREALRIFVVKSGVGRWLLTMTAHEAMRGVSPWRYNQNKATIAISGGGFCKSQALAHALSRALYGDDTKMAYKVI